VLSQRLQQVGSLAGQDLVADGHGWCPPLGVVPLRAVSAVRAVVAVRAAGAATA
jgi:hypothetical protein